MTVGSRSLNPAAPPIASEVSLPSIGRGQRDPPNPNSGEVVLLDAARRRHSSDTSLTIQYCQAESLIYGDPVRLKA
jgi:hypothetical protein